MTCIVAIPYKDKVYMGADTLGSNGFTKCEFPVDKSFIIDNRFLIGGTTSYRMLDLLQYNLSVPKVHPDDYPGDEKYMHINFLDAVRDSFKTGGFMKFNSSGEEGGNFLVGYNGVVYEIQPDMSILKAPEFGISVGSGEYAANAVLVSRRNKLTSKKQVKKTILKALDAASDTVVSVGGQYTMKEL